MIDSFVQFIRNLSGNRSRDELEEVVQSAFTTLRSWLSDNGEIAALVGFIIGILLVLAFEFIVVFLVVIALAGYVIWYVSSPSSDLAMTAVKELHAEQAAKDQEQDTET